MKDLEKKIGYKFKKNSKIKNAFTHSSYINESHEKNLKSYERLEFLGDAVLELVISEILFERFPDEKEGNLSRIRAKLVCEEGLYKIAKNINLGKYIRFSKGEAISGGRERKSILADVVESMLATIYLEESLDKVKEVIEVLFAKELESASKMDTIKDFKSALQIWLQARKKAAPIYKIIGEKGPDHDKTFKSAVYIEGEEFAIGIGKTKRESEQNAAKNAYTELTEKFDVVINSQKE